MSALRPNPIDRLTSPLQTFIDGNITDYQVISRDGKYGLCRNPIDSTDWMIGPSAYAFRFCSIITASTALQRVRLGIARVQNPGRIPAMVIQPVM